MGYGGGRCFQDENEKLRELMRIISLEVKQQGRDLWTGKTEKEKYVLRTLYGKVIYLVIHEL